MRPDDCIIICKELEKAFDIPFVVRTANDVNPGFYIHPKSQGDELFELKLFFRQNTRLIAEVYPEKYSAFMISAMGKSNNEKKHAFANYASFLLNGRHATVNFLVNGQQYSPSEPEEWPNSWESFHCRISKSPITADFENFNAIGIAQDWSVVIIGMFLSLLDIIPLSDGDGELPAAEGAIKQITQNKYERNPINRQLCLAANGYTCKVCGFNFENLYGEIGKDFIHVHHIVPVSTYGGSHYIDPTKDLVPVCPNCHAMLHREDPPLLPEQLKDLIRKQR